MPTVAFQRQLHTRQRLVWESLVCVQVLPNPEETIFLVPVGVFGVELEVVDDEAAPVQGRANLLATAARCQVECFGVTMALDRTAESSQEATDKTKPNHPDS